MQTSGTVYHSVSFVSLSFRSYKPQHNITLMNGILLQKLPKSSTLMGSIKSISSKPHSPLLILYLMKAFSHPQNLDWLKCNRNVDIVQKVFPAIKQLFTAVSSTLSVERVSSTFGLAGVHSKLRNSLSTKKPATLLLLYKFSN